MIEEEKVKLLIDYLRALEEFYPLLVDDQLEEMIKGSIKATSEEIESILISE